MKAREAFNQLLFNSFILSFPQEMENVKIEKKYREKCRILSSNIAFFEIEVVKKNNIYIYMYIYNDLR